jgi:hypothetical protein
MPVQSQSPRQRKARRHIHPLSAATVPHTLHTALSVKTFERFIHEYLPSIPSRDGLSATCQIIRRESKRLKNITHNRVVLA